MDSFLNRLLSTIVPPLKISSFVWKLAQDRIPSKENLLARGILQASSIFCSGCLQVEESSSHLFFACVVSSKVWMDCLRWLGVSSALQKDCKDHFEQFQGLLWLKSVNSDFCQAIWYSVIWFGWHATR